MLNMKTLKQMSLSAIRELKKFNFDPVVKISIKDLEITDEHPDYMTVDMKVETYYEGTDCSWSVLVILNTRTGLALYKKAEKICC